MQTQLIPTRSQLQRAEVIRLEGVCKYYGAGETRVTALDHVDMAIHAGNTVALWALRGRAKLLA